MLDCVHVPVAATSSDTSRAIRASIRAKPNPEIARSCSFQVPQYWSCGCRQYHPWQKPLFSLLLRQHSLNFSTGWKQVPRLGVDLSSSFHLTRPNTPPSYLLPTLLLLRPITCPLLAPRLVLISLFIHHLCLPRMLYHVPTVHPYAQVIVFRPQ